MRLTMAMKATWTCDMKTVENGTTKCEGYESPFPAGWAGGNYEYADSGDGYDYPETDTSKAIAGAAKKATQPAEKETKMGGDTKLSTGETMGGDKDFIDV